MAARLSVLTFLVLISNAAHSQQQGNPAMPCYQALAGESRFASIHDKVALGGAMDEMQRMTKIAERASTQEGAALSAWRLGREDCHRLEAGYYATRDAGIQALARDHFAAVQALITELQSGKLTYGEFGSRRIALYEKVTGDIEEIRRSIRPPKLPPHPGGK